MTSQTTESNVEGTDSEESRQTLLRQAYGAATARLREQHRTEFDTLYEEEANNRGVDYKRKPTAEEKAKAEVEALLEKFPHLRESITS